MKIILEEEDISNNECPKEVEEKFFNYGKEKVKYINEITDEDKGNWIEMTADELHEQFKSLLQFTEDGVSEIDNVDWDALNYKIYDEDYYRMTTPGLPDEMYKILAESSKHENLLIDERIPPLKKTDGEFRPFKKD